MFDRPEKGCVLIVNKLDQLGRGDHDASCSVANPEETGIRVHCLAPGDMDLTSSTGKTTLNDINAATTPPQSNALLMD